MTAAGTGLDLVDQYADYADVLEVPRILHELVAIHLVATRLNGNEVTIPLGAVKYSFDVWTLLLSGSGAGRSTTIGVARPILEAAGVSNLESAARWGSAAAVYQYFAENGNGVYF